MERAEIQKRLISLVAENIGVHDSDLSLSSNFVDDLDADSLDQIELVMAIEEEFEVEISDEEALAVKPLTVENMLIALDKIINGGHL